MKKVAGNLRIDLAQYRELEVFTQFSSDLDDGTKATLNYGSHLIELLKQPLYHPMALHKQILLLFAAGHKMLNDVPVKELKAETEEMTAFFEQKYPETVKKIDEGKVLTDDIAKEIQEAIEAYLKQVITMANIREIKTRMNSIEDTLKITNAMYLISSSKLKKARKQLDATTPYFEMLQAALLDIMAEENINEDDKLFVIGYMGRNYFGRRNAAQMDEDFFYTTQDPTIYRARRIAEKMIEEYVSGELDEVYIIYTKMITSITSEPKMIRVLPLNPDQYEFAGKGKRSHMTEFQPSVKAVLDRLAPNYIKGLVYGAMVESFSSELNARMMAMEGASKSAREMIRSLGLMYNRARQAAITQEITEVCAGAKSLKKE